MIRISNHLTYSTCYAVSIRDRPFPTSRSEPCRNRKTLRRSHALTGNAPRNALLVSTFPQLPLPLWRRSVVLHRQGDMARSLLPELRRVFQTPSNKLSDRSPNRCEIARS